MQLNMSTFTGTAPHGVIVSPYLTLSEDVLLSELQEVWPRVNRHHWGEPLGMLLTALGTLATAEKFNNWLFISAAVMPGLYWVVAIVALTLLAQALLALRDRPTPKKVVEALRDRVAHNAFIGAAPPPVSGSLDP